MSCPHSLSSALPPLSRAGLPTLALRGGDTIPEVPGDTPPSADVPTPGQVSLWDKALVENHCPKKDTISSWAGRSGAEQVWWGCFAWIHFPAFLPVTAPAVVLAQPSLTTACRTVSQECPAVYGPGAPASAAAIRDPRLLRAAVGPSQTVFTKGIRFVKRKIHPKIILFPDLCFLVLSTLRSKGAVLSSHLTSLTRG